MIQFLIKNQTFYHESMNDLYIFVAECDKASVYIIDGYHHDSITDVIKKNDASQVKFCGSQLYYTEEGMKSYLSTGNRLIVRYCLIILSFYFS